MRIGVFDSGVGGLTVLKELLIKHPNNQYYYFGDNKNAPYGSKSKKELTMLVSNIIRFLKEKDIDILIVACGTISSTVIDEVRKMIDIPVYDVISPTIDYLNNSCYDSIGVIATPMTIKSKAFDKVGKSLIKQPCPELAYMIETDNINDNILNGYLEPLKDRIEVLVLGCTHYPIVSDKINNYFDNKICLLNMGRILSDDLQLNEKGSKKLCLYFSKVDHTLIENIDRIIDEKYYLEEVDLEDKYARVTRS